METVTRGSVSRIKGEVNNLPQADSYEEDLFRMLVKEH